ncbi:hypothetical protein [Ottowia testudinis]|uniref:Uncharacterized protein n=1 Tax=Ottowia testudinis TaxID=2816950 RepID=A0A975CEY5_9BURK|nr:hypothetical protein [Ottowia testudinis]QTD45203.1 hypothetical protein J1M35_19655 [Ottowia testudinis]
MVTSKSIAARASWARESAVFHAEPKTFERKVRRDFAKAAEVFSGFLLRLLRDLCDLCVQETSKIIAARA